MMQRRIVKYLNQGNGLCDDAYVIEESDDAGTRQRTITWLEAHEIAKEERNNPDRALIETIVPAFEMGMPHLAA